MLCNDEIVRAKRVEYEVFCNLRMIQKPINHNLIHFHH